MLGSSFRESPRCSRSTTSSSAKTQWLNEQGPDWPSETEAAADLPRFASEPVRPLLVPSPASSLFNRHPGPKLLAVCTTACGGKRRSSQTVLGRGTVVGTKINEVMTERPRAVTPQTSVREAAQLMQDEDVGSLPVVEEGVRLVGVVTDRDVALRVVGGGLDPEATRVSEVASTDVVTLT